MSSWKISTVSPKRSFSGARSTLAKSLPCNSGGVYSGVPTGTAVDKTVLGVAYLKGVGIHQRYERIIPNEGVSGIHIANDVAARMQGMHGSGEIPRREVQAVVVKTMDAASGAPWGCRN